MTHFSGQPLFGKDSSPHYTSRFLGFIGTCCIWIIFLLCMVFIKPGEKAPKYKEVQIVLESVPEVKKEIKEEARDIETVKADKVPSSVKETADVAKKPSSKPVAVPHQENPVHEEVSQPVEDDYWDNFEYAMDPMEAFAQQTSSAPKEEADWDNMFGEPVISNTPDQQSDGGKVIGGNEIYGSQGKASGTGSSKVTSSAVNSESGTNMAASSFTTNTLGAISNTRFVESSNSNLSSETNMETSSGGDGKVYVKMSNGRTRALISPAKPVISLSEKASSLIDGNKTVTIKFLVTKDGNVPQTRVSITPEALLPDLVQQEIRSKVSQWLFEPDNYDAFAEFDYNIVIK